MNIDDGLLTKDYRKYLSCDDDSNIENRNRNIQMFLDAFQGLRDERDDEL